MSGNPDVVVIEAADGMSLPSTYTHRLFKYRSLIGDNREYTSRIITRRDIYYAAPRQFNDPFDGRISVNMEGAPLSEFGLSRDAEARAFAEKWFWDEMNKDLAVLSLTELNDNILMWSHYADGHRGICLDFTVCTSEELHRVRYADACPQFLFGDFHEQHRDARRLERSFIETLTTKSTCWSYEKEWRLIIAAGGPGERPFPRQMLTGIIFGCRTSDPDKETVRKWARSAGQPVAFHQAQDKDAQFTLEIRRID